MWNLSLPFKAEANIVIAYINSQKIKFNTFWDQNQSRIRKRRRITANKPARRNYPESEGLDYVALIKACLKRNKEIK